MDLHNELALLYSLALLFWLEHLHEVLRDTSSLQLISRIKDFHNPS